MYQPIFRAQMNTILVLSPHPDFAEGVRNAVSPEHYRIIHRMSVEEGEPLLVHGLVSTCILDADLLGVESVWIIERLRRRDGQPEGAQRFQTAQSLPVLGPEGAGGLPAGHRKQSRELASPGRHRAAGPTPQGRAAGASSTARCGVPRATGGPISPGTATNFLAIHPASHGCACTR